MLTTLVYVALALVAVSLAAMFVALRGEENTFQVLIGFAHIVAAVSVGQYLIWPAQPYALVMASGVAALAFASATVLGRLAAGRVRRAFERQRS